MYVRISLVVINIMGILTFIEFIGVCLTSYILYVICLTSYKFVTLWEVVNFTWWRYTLLYLFRMFVLKLVFFGPCYLYVMFYGKGIIIFFSVSIWYYKSLRVNPLSLTALSFINRIFNPITNRVLLSCYHHLTVSANLISLR